MKSLEGIFQTSKQKYDPKKAEGKKASKLFKHQASLCFASLPKKALFQRPHHPNMLSQPFTLVLRAKDSKQKTSTNISAQVSFVSGKKKKELRSPSSSNGFSKLAEGP
eukprot:m.20903 g.20903  ORF g.20903 m.20903 type:complete len:108 (-) comp7947_c0_seq1:43-366(-)